MKQQIRVKHIMEILKTLHPDAPIDFYNYGTNFDDADLSQLEIRGGRDASDMANIFIAEHPTCQSCSVSNETVSKAGNLLICKKCYDANQ